MRSICKLSYHHVMAAIDELRKLGEQWENRPQLIDQAREEGTTWDAIADALHMTRQGAAKLHATLTKDNS